MTYYLLKCIAFCTKVDLKWIKRNYLKNIYSYIQFLLFFHELQVKICQFKRYFMVLPTENDIIKSPLGPEVVIK